MVHVHGLGGGVDGDLDDAPQGRHDAGDDRDLCGAADALSVDARTHHRRLLRSLAAGMSMAGPDEAAEGAARGVDPTRLRLEQHRKRVQVSALAALGQATRRRRAESAVGIGRPPAR